MPAAADCADILTGNDPHSLFEERIIKVVSNDEGFLSVSLAGKRGGAKPHSTGGGAISSNIFHTKISNSGDTPDLEASRGP